MSLILIAEHEILSLFSRIALMENLILCCYDWLFLSSMKYTTHLLQVSNFIFHFHLSNFFPMGFEHAYISYSSLHLFAFNSTHKDRIGRNLTPSSRPLRLKNLNFIITRLRSRREAISNAKAYGATIKTRRPSEADMNLALLYQPPYEPTSYTAQLLNLMYQEEMHLRMVESGIIVATLPAKDQYFKFDPPIGHPITVIDPDLLDRVLEVFYQPPLPSPPFFWGVIIWAICGSTWLILSFKLTVSRELHQMYCTKSRRRFISIAFWCIFPVTIRTTWKCNQVSSLSERN